MIRLTKRLCLAVMSVLIAAQPTLVWAQTASEHFPNDAAGGGNVDTPGPGGVMELTLKVQGCSPIKVGGIALAAGASGPTVADLAATGLCSAAGSGCPACGAGTFPGGPVFCNCDGVAGSDYSITQLGFGVTAAPEGATPKVQALNCKTTAGNTHGDDLLRQVIVRVDPNGHNGNVVFDVHRDLDHDGTADASPATFTVNTTGKSDEAIHTEITAGYNNMGVGLTALTCTSAQLAGLSGAPETFPGFGVNISYSTSTQATLFDFEVDGEVDGTRGQILTMETVTPAGSSSSSTGAPTLSEWGIVFLVATLLLTGFWMLRRRRSLTA